MPGRIIEKKSLDFLRKLSKNNNREWFSKHKSQYLEAQGNMIGFADALLFEMNKHDKIETLSGKQSLFRIYKDVRFSKDKTPYNPHWNGFFKRATNKLRGGYYFNIRPGRTYIGGGFWGPEPADMRRIRADIDINYTDWEKLLQTKSIVKAFGKMAGNQLSSSPRGYAIDHPGINLLRYKQYILRHEFTDDEVLSREFAKMVSDTFKTMRPFLNYMSEVLTTDMNGVPLVD
jgi:uncharacterized protein (TIGR02453 family)